MQRQKYAQLKSNDRNTMFIGVYSTEDDGPRSRRSTHWNGNDGPGSSGVSLAGLPFLPVLGFSTQNFVH